MTGLIELVVFLPPDKARPDLTVCPSWLSPGASVTLNCTVTNQSAGWSFFWYQIVSVQPNNSYIYELLPGSIDGTEQTSSIFVSSCLCSVLDAVLMTDPNWSTFFTGESVTFICDMNEGEDADWEYKINKDGRDYVPYNTHQRYTSEPLSTGDSGDYQCVGRRRSSYSTKSSNTVSLTVSAKPKATLTADTTTISVGGSVTLTCSVQNSVGWKYEWFRRTQRTSEVLVDPVRTNDELNTVISVSQGGIYQCRGTRGKPVYYTDISDEVTTEKTLSNEAVLRRQPDWTQMFSGERINLTCEIHGGETTLWMYDWRGPQYYVPWTDDNYQTFRVSESNSGDYMCRSRPSDDSYSSTEWSKSITLSVSGKSSASLTVNPDTVQHFGSKSASLRCDGNSTKWRVSRFTDDGFQRQCFFWGTMNGSTCNLNWMWYGNAVYWCESGSAFSNAVNITGQYNDGIILVSPVHPVTEGDSVTLGCKLRTQNVLSNVFFYKDNKLIQNDSRGEMSISAVSESDEGFYKCQYSGKESPQSWMAVKSVSEKSSFPVLLITGLVCGVLLILILLFLLVCCCRKIKGEMFYIQ
uniref:Ig-like domain-containing protein n=1 Tax=Amphiprion percula TaxID=161767 RepID=A0A3P8RUT6_AMPPE